MAKAPCGEMCPHESCKILEAWTMEARHLMTAGVGPVWGPASPFLRPLVTIILLSGLPTGWVA